jgi:hypothetical protein
LIFDLFKIFCNKDYNYYIKTWIDKNTKEEYTSISFTTMELPCFIEIHNTWYVKGKKRIPNNIMDILTPIGLAHWIMGNGSRHNLGLHLSVYAFTWDEVQLLINVLESKFGLKCSIHKLSSITPYLHMTRNVPPWRSHGGWFIPVPSASLADGTGPNLWLNLDY